VVVRAAVLDGNRNEKRIKRDVRLNKVHRGKSEQRGGTQGCDKHKARLKEDSCSRARKRKQPSRPFAPEIASSTLVT